jgi:hypothetical protein
LDALKLPRFGELGERRFPAQKELRPDIGAEQLFISTRL